MTLNTYRITAWCDRTFTAVVRRARRIPRAGALNLPDEQVHDEAAEECDMDYPWDTFRVCDAEEHELLT